MSGKRTRAFLNRDSRAEYGCIVSFLSESGAELTLHRTGQTRDTLPQMCADALAADPTFRVVAYSTPQTIYDDLQGRSDYDGASGHRIEPTRPEKVLANFGLGYMAHPRLRLGVGDSDAQARRRERGERVRA